MEEMEEVTEKMEMVTDPAPVEVEKDVAADYEMEEEVDDIRKTKVKKNKPNHKNKKKVEKMKDAKKKIKFATTNMVEDDVEEKVETVKTVEAETSDKKPKLGFLGEIFKAIVNVNTFRS